MSYLKVRDNFDLVRDERSSAILNVNQKELNKYKQARDDMFKLKKISDDHNKIKNDIQEIKDLLNILLRQNNV
jgi:conjugal transfer/entry exclusion protein